MAGGAADLFLENRTFDELTVGETASLSPRRRRRRSVNWSTSRTLAPWQPSWSATVAAT